VSLALDLGTSVLTVPWKGHSSPNGGILLPQRARLTEATR
jgi:hypothetical protein